MLRQRRWHPGSTALGVVERDCNTHPGSTCGPIRPQIPTPSATADACACAEGGSGLRRNNDMLPRGGPLACGAPTCKRVGARRGGADTNDSTGLRGGMRDAAKKCAQRNALSHRLFLHAKKDARQLVLAPEFFYIGAKKSKCKNNRNLLPGLCISLTSLDFFAGCKECQCRKVQTRRSAFK